MANLNPITFGILGAARIAPNALTLPCKQVLEAEVVVIAARDQDRAREFAKTNDIARVLATYEDVIADPEVEVIYNPLPNSMHCEWTIKALEAGKHVLCEKPIASNAAEAEKMQRVADATGKILGEAFHYRYHPLADRVRQLMHDGTLGRLIHVEGHFAVPIPPTNIRFDWNLAGGATMDLGCYPLHMIRYFSGLTPRVIGAKAEIGPPNIDIKMETDLELAPGVTARMTCSMTADAQLSTWFSARGDRASLKVTNPVGPHWGHQLTITTPEGETIETVPGDTTYTHQLRAFVAAVRGGARFPTDGVDGIVGMRIIDDVYRAAGLPPRAT